MTLMIIVGELINDSRINLTPLVTTKYAFS